MEWNPQADQATVSLWMRVAKSVKAFLTFRTQNLIDLSEWKDPAARFALTASLFTVAVAAMAYASSRFYPGSEGSSEFIGWSVWSAIAFSILLVVPMVLGFSVLRLPRRNFTLNVVLLQQALLALGAVFASLILMSQEPAQTDFSLLREGRAEGTLAHRRFCGDLKAAARLHALAGRTIERTASVQRDIDEVDSWGDPEHASTVQVLSRFPRLKVHLRHRQRELRAAEADLERYETLNAERESVYAAFNDKYPTYALAQQFFGAWCLAFIGLALLHLWRGLTLGDRGDRSRVTVIADTALSSGIAIAFIWWISVTGELPSYRDMVVSPPAVSLLQGEENPSTFEELRAEAQSFRIKFVRLQKDHKKERDELRGQFYRLRRSCPRISTVGL